MTDTDRITCAQTAKLVRAALKQAFPRQKFSVRSSTYAGGASIDVTWTDGPQVAAVDDVVKPYAGGDFDGMTDSMTYNSHWLMPDGTAVLASRTRDFGGQPIRPEDAHDYSIGRRIGAGITNTVPPHDPDSLAYRRGVRDAKALVAKGARLVHFGADFVMTHRQFSGDYRAYLENAVLFLSGQAGPFDGNRRYSFGIRPNDDTVGRAYEDYGNTLVWQVSQVEPKTLTSALEREAKRRADANAQAATSPVGFYVTVMDGDRWGTLLGPYADKPAADANVTLGKRLAEQVNDRAIWYAYGVTKVTMKPGQPLPAGKLAYLAVLDSAGLSHAEPSLVTSYIHTQASRKAV